MSLFGAFVKNNKGKRPSTMGAMTSLDLGTSAADLAAATTERVVGVAGTGFWSALPQASQEITVEKGTKLIFKWSEGHDLVITSKDVWDSCGRCSLEGNWKDSCVSTGGS